MSDAVTRGELAIRATQIGRQGRRGSKIALL